MRVNVVLARVRQVWEVDLDCKTGTRVLEAVKLAVAREEFNGVDLSGDESFAVWNQVVHEDHVLHEGDRVEVLRELIVNPMERRRIYANLNASD